MKKYTIELSDKHAKELKGILDLFEGIDSVQKLIKKFTRLGMYFTDKTKDDWVIILAKKGEAPVHINLKDLKELK